MKNLVIQAYEMREAHEENRPWKLDYGDYKVVETIWAKPVGFFARKEMFGFIARAGNTLKVVIPGTVSHHDWLSDANIDLVDHKIGQVHEGVWDLYQQMQDKINFVINKNSGYEVDILAHSLGCGPAGCCAANLFKKNPHVTLYAPMRFVDIDFSNNYARLVLHSRSKINLEDVVPNWPSPHRFCQLQNVDVVVHNTGDVVKNHSMELYARLFDI